MRTLGIGKTPGHVCLAFFTLGILLIACPSFSQTIYIDDQLIVSMREGPGSEYKAIRALKTGTPMTVLEDQERYAKVRLQDGKEGWVQKQYTSTALPKTEVIARLEREIERLKKRAEEHDKNLVTQQNELKATKSDHADKVKKMEEDVRKSSEEITRTSQELKRVTEQYNTLAAASKRTVELVDENKKLKNENKSLSGAVSSLSAENTILKQTGMIYWFLAGGSVLFAGFLIGRITKKKRYYY